ncbi:hypothetical protein KRP22_014402 [Phytophthora ramorum]|nr:hypothetical protein KRP22_8994 [Phytophthora ramorum]
MVAVRSTTLFLAAALALHNQVDAAPCDADNYSKVATAVQTLHANCASWAAYLASGGVWTCDSACHDAVVNLVDTLPDCTFGGPYGQNYKQVVEGMVETCSGAVSSSSDSTEAPTSTTGAPSATTPAATTSSGNNTTDTSTSTTTTTTEAPTAATKTPDSESASNANASTSASADVVDVSTTSGASTQAVATFTALVLVVAGPLLH